MVMGNAISSRESVSPIKVIIWNEEPLMGFEIFPVQSSPVNCCWPYSVQSFLVSAPSGPMTIILFFPDLWGLLFEERRGLATAGHSPSTGGESAGARSDSLLHFPSYLYCHILRSLLCPRHYINSARTALKTFPTVPLVAYISVGTIRVC
jgi:hypothetical protein